MSSTSSGRAERRATTDDIRLVVDDGQLGTGARDDDVGGGELVGQQAGGHDPAAGAGGERRAPLGRAWLATTSSATPRPASATAAASPTSPAPTTTTFDRLNDPRRSSAISTAACETDAVPRPIPVSDRARLPTSSARRKSRLSDARGAPSLLGQLPCVADLAEDLGLAEHRRAQAGGHLEQVGDRLFVVLADEVDG